MRQEFTPLWGEKKVELRETKRAVTPWGGLLVFVEFLRKIEYVEAVGKHLPFVLTSPNALDPIQTFRAFQVSVLTGARRFAHTGLLRTDVALRRVIGMVRFPSDDTLRNFFRVLGKRRPTVFTRGCGPGRWDA